MSHIFYLNTRLSKEGIKRYPMTTVSQDVQTRFSVQMAFAKFLSKMMGNI